MYIMKYHHPRSCVLTMQGPPTLEARGILQATIGVSQLAPESLPLSASRKGWISFSLGAFLLKLVKTQLR